MTAKEAREMTEKSTRFYEGIGGDILNAAAYGKCLIHVDIKRYDVKILNSAKSRLEANGYTVSEMGDEWIVRW